MKTAVFFYLPRQNETLQKCWLKYALTVFLNLKVLSQVYLQQTKHISFSCFHVFHKLQPALLSMESVACCSQFHDHTCSSQEPRKRAWGHRKEPQKKKTKQWARPEKVHGVIALPRCDVHAAAALLPLAETSPTPILSSQLLFSTVCFITFFFFFKSLAQLGFEP